MLEITEAMYGQDLGLFKLTYYCACAKCCGKATGITASGARVAEGETIAVDPSVIPYGTKVIINGHIFTAQDCGVRNREELGSRRLGSRLLF